MWCQKSELGGSIALCVDEGPGPGQIDNVTQYAHSITPITPRGVVAFCLFILYALLLEYDSRVGFEWSCTKRYVNGGFLWELNLSSYD